MITIIPYRSAWSEEFAAFGGSLRQALGEIALRIDHIGSTAVTGLAAKDIIDIQITVQRYHLNNTGELAEIRAYLISEHGEIKTFTPTY